ncbi:MAG: hypothetical protein ACTH31_12500 [Pseudoclavibacter sp.]
MELKVNIQVSVDGVFQANGGNHPDFDPGMERGERLRTRLNDILDAHTDNAFHSRRIRA